MGTFFMERNKRERFFLSFISLLLLITFPYVVEFKDYQIQVPAIILAIICIIQISKYSFLEKIHLLIRYITVSFGYSGFLFMALYDPVWLIVEKKYMTIIFLVIIIHLLGFKDLKKMMVCLIISVTQGDIIYSVGLERLGIPTVIGAPDTLDTLALSSLVILMVKGFAAAAYYLESKQQFGKKQKQI
uniref:YphA family membrane protein n=1 Tax=Falsibacillus albus TaxID=2478915 RepID=UPI0011E5B642|nr:hypothetical protein [Falsibacillus albus]